MSQAHSRRTFLAAGALGAAAAWVGSSLRAAEPGSASTALADPAADATAEAFLQAGAEGKVDAAEVEALIAARLQARAEKNWAESDRIRDQLTAMGVVLEDGKGGTTWRLAE